MKKYLLSLIAIFIMVPAFASPEAEFKKISKEYTFYPDGSNDIRCYKELTIKSHVALNNLYGETFVVYNPNFQSVKINSSYTRQADGNIVKTPVNAFNEVLPGNAANAPAYNHLRELVITHTGLEIGATIYLDYTLHTKAGYLPQGIMPEIDDQLQEQSPVKEAVVKMNIPASMPFNYILTGSKEKPQVVEKEGMKQYSWTFKNIPAASHEPYIPADQNYVPRLTACCYESQAGALKVLYNNFTNSSNELIESTVKKVINGKEKELEKIMAIQKYVANDIALCRLDFEATGFSSRTPDAVIRTAYGTEMEKHMLLASMLKAIGQNPEITVAYPSILKNGVKGLLPVSQILVKVDDNGKTLFLSALRHPTPQIGLDASTKDIWMVSEKEALPLNILEKASAIEYKANIQLKTDKASVEGKLFVKGGLIPTMDELSTQNHLKNLAAEAGKTTSANVVSSDPRNASLDFKAEKELSLTQDYLFYYLPTVSTGVKTWNMYQLNSSRKNHFELPYPINEKYEYEVIISPEFISKIQSKEIKMDKPFGKMHISISKNGDAILVKKEISFNKTRLTPTEYQDFRKMLNTWNDLNLSMLILKKGK